jgi:NADH-quinone oxidoreductase subunit C
VPEETKQPNLVAPDAEKSAAPAEAAVTKSAASETTLAGPAKPAEQVKAAAAPPTGNTPAAAAAPSAVPATEAKPAAAAPAKVLPAAKPAAPAAKPAPKPEPWDSPLVAALKAQYGSGIREASTYVGQKYLVVDSSIVFEILLRMRDDELFDYCVDITAVHYPKREAQFDIVYILYSFHNNERIRVKTQIKDGETLRSAFAIWPTANWLEREVFDMFGISFVEHPELKRILMPEDWKGSPLRKDYPILQQDNEWVKINLGIESGQ